MRRGTRRIEGKKGKKSLDLMALASDLALYLRAKDTSRFK